MKLVLKSNFAAVQGQILPFSCSVKGKNMAATAIFNVAQEAGTLAVQGHGLDRRPSFSDRVVGNNPEQDVGIRMINLSDRIVSTSYMHVPFIQDPVWVSRYTYLFIHLLQHQSRKGKFKPAV